MFLVAARGKTKNGGEIAENAWSGHKKLFRAAYIGIGLHPGRPPPLDRSQRFYLAATTLQ
jgi:hypothetical protein